MVHATVLENAQDYWASQLSIARAEAVAANCRQQQAASDCNQGRQRTQCLAATIDLLPLLQHGYMTPYAPWRYMPARKVNLHPIAMLHPGPLKRVLKLQRINRTTVVVARIPDDAAHITDGGQD